MNKTADTSPAPFDAVKRHRMTVDWTVNIVNVGGFAAMIVTAASLYFGLEKRISLQEERAPVEAAARKEKDATVQRSLSELSADMKDVKTAVDKVSRSIEVQAAVAEAKEKRK